MTKKRPEMESEGEEIDNDKWLKKKRVAVPVPHPSIHQSIPIQCPNLTDYSSLFTHSLQIALIVELLIGRVVPQRAEDVPDHPRGILHELGVQSAICIWWRTFYEKIIVITLLHLNCNHLIASNCYYFAY